MGGDRHAQAARDEPLLGLHDHLNGLVRQLLPFEEPLMRLGSLLLEGVHRPQAFLHDLQGAGQVGRRGVRGHGIRCDRCRVYGRGRCGLWGARGLRDSSCMAVVRSVPAHLGVSISLRHGRCGCCLKGGVPW